MEHVYQMRGLSKLRAVCSSLRNSQAPQWDISLSSSSCMFVLFRCSPGSYLAVSAEVTAKKVKVCSMHGGVFGLEE